MAPKMDSFTGQGVSGERGFGHRSSVAPDGGAAAPGLLRGRPRSSLLARGANAAAGLVASELTFDAALKGATAPTLI